MSILNHSTLRSLNFVRSFSSKRRWVRLTDQEKANLKHEKKKKETKRHKYDKKKIIETQKRDDPNYKDIESSVNLDLTPNMFTGVYQDEKYIIVNKAHQFSVQEDSQNKRGIISKLKEQDPDIRGVHRIDKNVTGGLLIAKTKFAARSFSRNLKLGGNTGFKFIRRYVGLIPSEDIVSNSPILESIQFYNDKNKGRIVSHDEEGRQSITDFIKYDKLNVRGYQMIILQLTTGRKHQIRKHLSEILGKPLRNDVKYGAVGLIQPQNCIGLHSAFIETHVGQLSTVPHFGTDLLIKKVNSPKKSKILF
ncbi:hypothetical protein WICPIJ_004054 [Wickerhamomyces pijperi]|uniref:21S rRNA pseudouridine(2819) synthase n=1 Tax=Wickerhamomyces pijperi TaxID=599730 RepID=A0A9P8Q8F9_WICPI|nr:hypothetical protein WICPIJ_004054 [Wickerhamomyces pijperi]